MAEQLSAMKGLSLRGDRLWMARATTSLPVPLSPLMTTLAVEGETFFTSSKTFCMAGPEPIMSVPGASAASRRRRSCTSRMVSFFSSARSSTIRSRGTSSGFSMKSKAPSRMAWTAVWMVPRPVRSTTGHSGSSARRARSSQSPSMLGMTRSVRMTSGCHSMARRSASVPSLAVWTS